MSCRSLSCCAGGTARDGAARLPLHPPFFARKFLVDDISAEPSALTTPLSHGALRAGMSMRDSPDRFTAMASDCLHLRPRVSVSPTNHPRSHAGEVELLAQLRQLKRLIDCCGSAGSSRWTKDAGDPATAGIGWRASATCWCCGVEMAVKTTAACTSSDSLHTLAHIRLSTSKCARMPL